MAYKLKLSDDGKPVVADGLPVFVDDNGADVAFNPNTLHAKILSLNSESKARREKIESLQERVAALDGIEDVAAFRAEAEKAIDMVKTLGAKDKEAAEKLKAEIAAAYEAKEKSIRTDFLQREKDITGKYERERNKVRKLALTAHFASHPLFAGPEPKTILPPDIAETYFGKHFEVTESATGDPVVLAKNASGDLIYSRVRPGEPADFREAMDILFETYPGRDKLIRPVGGGSGSGGGSGAAGVVKTPIDRLEKELAECKDPARRVLLKFRINELRKQRR